MRYVLINPSWQVPDSIIKKEMASKLGALGRRGYEVKTIGGRLTVRQLPGDDNALGRFAFMFPNDHARLMNDPIALQHRDGKVGQIDLDPPFARVARLPAPHLHIRKNRRALAGFGAGECGGD